MAGGSEFDHEFLKDIHRQIQDFSEGPESIEDATIRLIPSHGDTSHQNYQQQITNLEKEISDLENLLQKQETAPSVDAKHVQEVMTLLQEKIPNQNSRQRIEHNKKSLEDINQDIARLEKQLTLNASMTGVDLTDTTYKVLSFDDGVLEKENIIKGSCFDVDFELRICIMEKQDDAGKCRASVTDLEIYVGEEVLNTLHSALERVANMKSVELFFTVLPPAAKLIKCRTYTYANLMQRYADFVQFPENLNGKTVVFQGQKSGICWSITWNINIADDFTVSEDLDLKIKASSSVLKQDRRQVLDSAPGMFQKMVKTLGAAQAVDTIVQTAYETKDT